jgi:hypothetical protein
LGVKAIAKYDHGESTKLIIGGGDGTLNVFTGTGNTFQHEQKIQIIDISNNPSGVSINSVSLSKNLIMAGTSSGDVFSLQFDNGKVLGKTLLTQNHVGSVLMVDFPTGINDKVCGLQFFNNSLLQFL